VDPEPLFPATPASKRRSERAERRRQRILDAAARCFGENGFTKTTVEEIAGNAGVSKGLVYGYFRSKDDLLDIVLDRTLEEWAGVTWNEIQQRSQGTLNALAVWHRASLDYARRNPVLRAMIQLDSRVFLAGHQDLIQRAMKSWSERLTELLREGVESGELRSDLEVERTAEVIQVFHLTFIRGLFEPGSIDMTDEPLIRATIDLMHHGVAGPARSGEGSQ
jgi:AcrR family transcriptional regulator